MITVKLMTSGGGVNARCASVALALAFESDSDASSSVTACTHG